MKGYFDSIPVEIEEASKIDGAGNLTLIAKIILPLARPAIIVTAVMVLIFVWNEYLLPLPLCSGKKAIRWPAACISFRQTITAVAGPCFQQPPF